MIQRCCKECKYADFDADGCTCLIDKRSIYNAFAYSCDQFRPAKPMTNADRIRNMTVEELAKFMCLVKDKLCFGCSFSHVDECEGISCEEARKQWLKQEVGLGDE